jgi:hypothetical protein
MFILNVNKWGPLWWLGQTVEIRQLGPGHHILLEAYQNIWNSTLSRVFHHFQKIGRKKVRAEKLIFRPNFIFI